MSRPRPPIIIKKEVDEIIQKIKDIQNNLPKPVDQVYQLDEIEDFNQLQIEILELPGVQIKNYILTHDRPILIVIQVSPNASSGNGIINGIS